MSPERQEPKRPADRQPGSSGSSRPSNRSGRAKRQPPRLGPPEEGMFRDVALAPDREIIPEARPVISIHEDEEVDFQREVERRLLHSYPLRRRGVEHGFLAELRPEGLLGPRPRRRRRETIESERWYAGQPIFLPLAAESVASELDPGNMERLRRELAQPEGLASYLARRRSDLEPGFELSEGALPLVDAERDIARAGLAARGAVGDLWIKSSRLSTFADDHSLRVRLSFGEEGDDDASADEARHAQVGALAELLLPGARALAHLEDLRAKLERHVGGEVCGTQHIAYWNAPEGGARFHHDAFPDELEDSQEPVEEDAVAQEIGARAVLNRQRGVVYAQLTGATLWLTLSIDELVLRTREFLGWMEEGDAPELREALDVNWPTVRERASTYSAMAQELGLPDQGILGALVNAPQFTGYLADAGHAVVLHPGDVLLLPNHGLRRTAMHSVFCASAQPGYALSVALRRRQG